MKVRRFDGVVLLAVGAALLLAAVGVRRPVVRQAAGERREMIELERQLDSVRALARATPDSARAPVAAHIADRERMLAWRAFHVPGMEERARRYWHVGGVGFTLAAFGLPIVALGLWALRRAQSGDAGR